MLAAFHLNLTALSCVALLVGLFLVYNTSTVSVIARREEVGTLRALGVTRRQVLGLFLGEAAVMGVAGTVLGIGLGRVLADLAVGAHRGHRQHALHRHRVGAAGARPWRTWCWPSRWGCRCRWSRPASRRSRPAGSPPTAAMRGDDRLESRDAAAPAGVRRAGAGPRSGRGAARLGPVDGRPLFAYAAAFAVILGASLLVPAIIFVSARWAAGPLRRVFGIEGRLAHANLDGGDSAAGDLHRRAGGQPVDDGGRSP